MFLKVNVSKVMKLDTAKLVKGKKKSYSVQQYIYVKSRVKFAITFTV